VFEASAANIERRTERFDLASGMKVALLPKQTRGDAVQATLTIHYGSEAELQGKTSATRLMPSMLMRGTRKLDYQQIQDKLDALHAVVRVSATEPGQVTFQITTVGEQLAGMLDLLADVLTQPSFAPGELAVLRRDLISELETELQDPTEQGFNAALRAAQPAAPTDVRYLPTTAESIARVRAVKLADVKQLHQRLFGGGAAELAIVGDFEPAAAKRVLESRYANWRSPRPFGHIDRVYREAPAVSEKLDTPDKAMAFVVTALPVQIRDDAPEYPALALASFILGGAADSRLFARLREKEGWSYGAFSGLQVDSIDDLGLLYAAAALRRHIVAARLSRVVAGDLKQVELQ
jgi:zinc protease